MAHALHPRIESVTSSDSCQNPNWGFRVIRSYFRLPPDPGGMEMHIASLSEAQRQLGIEVINVHNTGQQTKSSLRVLPYFDLLAIRPAAVRNALFYSGVVLSRGRLRGTGPTVLHVHGDWSDFLLSKGVAKMLQAELVVASFHGSLQRRIDSLYASALSHCGLVFATGRDEQQYLSTVLGRDVHHLPSAPAQLFSEAPRSPSATADVVSVANCFANKRLDLVLACAERHPGLRFAVCGDGPLLDELKRTAVARNLGNVAFLGRLSALEVAAALRSARVFLSTAEREGTPTAALEAMMCGIPVILTPSNDYRWLVKDGVHGFVTSGWDIGEIAMRISAVLHNEDRRAQMGDQARLRAIQHTWKGNAITVSTLMSEQLWRQK